MIATVVPARRTNWLGLRLASYKQLTQPTTYLLTSLRSQLSPAQYSVFVWRPSPVLVAAQAQTKQVRPVLLACTHEP